MSEELRDFDDELKKLTAEVQKGLDSLSKLKGKQRQSVGRRGRGRGRLCGARRAC